MLDRFKVPDEDKIYVPVDKITEVTQNILKASGVSEEGTKRGRKVRLLGSCMAYMYMYMYFVQECT